MALTDEQIVTVQEIILEGDFDYVSSLCSNFNGAQEARCIALVDEWDTNGYGHKEGDVLPNKGDILFNQLGRVRKIRYTIRVALLNLTPISDAEIEIAQMTGTFGSNTPGKGGGSGGADIMDFAVMSTGSGDGGDELSP